MFVINFFFLLLAIISCLCARWFGEETAIKLNLIFLLVVLILNGFIFYESALGFVTEVPLFNWFNLMDVTVGFSFFYDFLSSSMLFLVVFISFFVHIYSYSYMDNDPGKARFFCYLSLFTFFMALLVVSSSFVQFFFAWEGVGITSYLLINFWFTRYEANRAALKALIINRFGDFGLYTGILFILVFFKTNSLMALNCLSYSFENFFVYFKIFGFDIPSYSFIAFFIFLGVVGKSAQLGLHT
jgi:NADH:ubiquinone oxidoreductase subunit 5 (subunit L)/multisubunit Na+/H+ antiporter MnhA subunit